MQRFCSLAATGNNKTCSEVGIRSSGCFAGGALSDFETSQIINEHENTGSKIVRARQPLWINAKEWKWQKTLNLKSWKFRWDFRLWLLSNKAIYLDQHGI